MSMLNLNKFWTNSVKKVFCSMFGLVMTDVMTLSGHLSNINEITVQLKSYHICIIFHDFLSIFPHYKLINFFWQFIELNVQPIIEIAVVWRPYKIEQKIYMSQNFGMEFLILVHCRDYRLFQSEMLYEIWFRLRPSLIYFSQQVVSILWFNIDSLGAFLLLKPQSKYPVLQ